MVFHVHPPSRQLHSFVQCYLEADCTGSLRPEENTLFPNGLSGIFFNFGKAGRLFIKEDYKTPAVSIFGQIDRHFTVAHEPGFYSLGVMLKPTVLSKLFGIDMGCIVNTAFDGKPLDRNLDFLHQQMEDAPSIKTKIRLFEHYLVTRLSQKACSKNMADYALDFIHRHETFSPNRLARHLGIGPRHLEMQFKKSVGLSPKTYSLILRFKRVEQQLSKSTFPGWKDMAFANEFHDQNHFIKDFKRFTGLTPSKYFLEKMEMGRSYLTAR
jgi:AraC-like DNA-binding protein